MPAIETIRQPITRADLAKKAEESFGDMIKAVVDVERRIMAIGGELHADEEKLLLEDGSKQEDLWGINFYPDETDEDWIEYDSMINIRPTQNNRSRDVENPDIQKRIREIADELIQT